MLIALVATILLLVIFVFYHFVRTTQLKNKLSIQKVEISLEKKIVDVHKERSLDYFHRLKEEWKKNKDLLDEIVELEEDQELGQFVQINDDTILNINEISAVGLDRKHGGEKVIKLWPKPFNTSHYFVFPNDLKETIKELLDIEIEEK